LALTGTLLLSGCAELGAGSGSRSDSGEYFDQVCADLEAGLISASSVFQETLGTLRAPTTSDAVPFFSAMGDIVQITLGAMLDPSLGTELSEAVQEMSSASLEVQGLLTQRPPEHLKAQETIKPAVTKLAVACFRSEIQFANGGELFLSSVEPEQAEIVDYSLQNAADPEITLERMMLRGLEAQGIIGCSDIIGPNFDKPVDAPVASAMLVTVCSRSPGGTIVIYRYENSADETAHIPWLNELVGDVDNYWLLSSPGLAMANFGGDPVDVNFIAQVFDMKRVD
jgi:hypothetical protein